MTQSLLMKFRWESLGGLKILYKQTVRLVCYFLLLPFSSSLSSYTSMCWLELKHRHMGMRTPRMVAHKVKRLHFPLSSAGETASFSPGVWITGAADHRRCSWPQAKSCRDENWLLQLSTSSPPWQYAHPTSISASLHNPVPSSSFCDTCRFSLGGTWIPVDPK